MLEARSMATQVISNLNHSVMCLTYLQSIKDYTESNIQIMATYVGVTPIGTPDPLNGPIQLNLVITPSMPQGAMVLSFLRALQSPNPSAFIEAIFSEMITDLIMGPSTHTLTATAIYTVNNFTSAELQSLREADNYVDCWNIVCEPIVRSFRTMKAVPPSIPTVTASGTGVTTITSVL